MTHTVTKQLGLVVRVKSTLNGGYGNIKLEDREKWVFFHSRDVKGGVLPTPGSRVVCDVIEQPVETKRDIAINVEIVSTPG